MLAAAVFLGIEDAGASAERIGLTAVLHTWGSAQVMGDAHYLPQSALLLDPGGGRVLVEKLRQPILEDDDVFLSEEIRPIDVQNWHRCPPGKRMAARPFGRSDC